MTSTTDQISRLITHWHALHCSRGYYRIHTSIYDTKGFLVVADCEEDAIEHVFDTLDMTGDAEWFAEIVADHAKEGKTEEEAHELTSGDFIFINGAIPLDISEWRVRPANKQERETMDRVAKLSEQETRTDADLDELAAILAKLDN